MTCANSGASESNWVIPDKQDRYFHRNRRATWDAVGHPLGRDTPPQAGGRDAARDLLTRRVGCSVWRPAPVDGAASPVEPDAEEPIPPVREETVPDRRLDQRRLDHVPARGLVSIGGW
jgi:hypothetical protein